MSLEGLAGEMGCEPRTLQRYEKGDSPIPPEFVRKLEKFRVDDLVKRARALGKDKIDLSKFLAPGLELVPLVPIRRVAGTMLRLFIAVPKEEDSPSPEVEPASPAPASASSAQSVQVVLARGPLPEGTTLVENVLSIEVENSESQTRTFSAVLGIVPPPDHNTGQSTTVAQVIQAPSKSKAGRRRTVRLAMVACLAYCTLVTGCLLSHRGTPTAQLPDQLPEKLDTDTAKDGKESMGSGHQDSIPMPDKPYSWQKVAPCGKGEREKIGGCWIISRDPPPCPHVAVESDGACYVPVPATPAKPNTVEPNK